LAPVQEIRPLLRYAAARTAPAPDLKIGIFQMKNVARYARLSCYIQLSNAFAFSESVF
jgi:hypothetical protein